jgi:arylsulfatase A-like enzyme
VGRTGGAIRPILALAAAVLFAACGQTREKPHGVVFLMLDTVRADRLSAYGYDRPTTPNLEALARRGTLFEQPQSASSWTVPAVASVLTGLLPTEHGAIIEGGGPAHDFPAPTYFGFHKDLPSLPRQMRASGYRTFGRIANILMGLDCFRAGFDRVVVGDADAARVVDWAVERLDEVGDDPFFFYLHFMDTHVPLEPPDECLALFLPDGTNPDAGTEASTWSEYKKVEDLESGSFRDFRARKRDFYDASLAYLDREIGRLFGELESRGILDDTLIVVTADHGEEFWDHAEIQRECYDTSIKEYVGCSHGHTMFQELLRVPLILAGPSVKAGFRVEERVRVLDIGATLFELMEGPRGPQRAGLGESVSLVSVMRGGRPKVERFLSESITRGHELKSVVDADGYKLIRAMHDSERDLLFHLGEDPGEVEDLLAREPERGKQLRELLDARVQFMGARRKRGAAAGEEGTKALKDLGYTGDDEESGEDRGG